MADGCIQLRECARPRTDEVAIENWRMVLQWLPSGIPGLVPKHWSDSVDLITDVPGVEVRLRRRGLGPERRIGNGDGRFAPTPSPIFE